MNVAEKIHHLEMTSPGELRGADLPNGVDLLVRRVLHPSPEYNRFFYTAIGGDWGWTDRLPWTYARWLAFLTRPGHETWAAYLDGAPAGYFELDRPDSDPETVEIASFGLLPAFAGRGLGRSLLTFAVRRAWRLDGCKRVYVHTSSLDHPGALGNYLARGFLPIRVEEKTVEKPDSPNGPWPGAERPLR